MKHQAFDVFRPQAGRIRLRKIDTVFFSGNVDIEEVRRSLINHDGYAADIVVRKARKPRSRKR